MSKEKTAHIVFLAKVYMKPSEQNNFVALFESGTTVTLLKEQGNWVKVDAGDGQIGWIKKSTLDIGNNKTTVVHNSVSTAPLSAPQNISNNLLENPLTIPIAIGFVIFTIISALIYFLFFRKKKETMDMNITRVEMPRITKETLTPRNSYRVLIIADKNKSVKNSVSNIHIKMSAFFRDIGFTVYKLATLKNLSVNVTDTPDIIIIDTELGRKVISIAEQEIVNAWRDNLPVVFYNIDDPDIVTPSEFLQQSYYLGKQISDTDLIKITAPTLKTDNEEGSYCSLQGKIQKDGLYEVIQFLEIGQKDGILRVRKLDNSRLGSISFDKGQIIHGETDIEKGKDAVLSILKCYEGSFEFFSMKPKNRNCVLNATAVMMESVKNFDENTDLYSQTSN